MLSDYRAFLVAELELLGNASHHAYSFGQANMAKRAIERLDTELADRVPLLLAKPDARAVLAALEMLEQRDSALDAALGALRDDLRAAVADVA